jgi:hypothetical protein
VDEFASVMEMTNQEKDRLIKTFESLNNGEVAHLPDIIINFSSEGLTSLVDELIKTRFLEKSD